MKFRSDTEIKHGSCCPNSEMKTSHVSRALTINSTSNASLSRLLSLGNEERKAVEAYKLQVEQRRSMAIEFAHKNTIR